MRPAVPASRLWNGQLRHACPLCRYDSPSVQDVAMHIYRVHPGGMMPEFNVELSIRPEPVGFGWADAPLISCIMSTKNRPSFVSQSIKYFLAQTWPNKELIIVDDSDFGAAPDISQFCSQASSSIDPRYARPLLKLDRVVGTIGKKRNAGIAQACGEFIAVWDDDEWQSPNRLALQWREFTPDVDLVGIYRPIFGDVSSRKVYIYGGPKPNAGFVSGSTIMFRRSLWHQVKYPNMNIGEDQTFIQEAPQKKIKQVEYSGFNVSFVHAANTVTKRVTQWPYVELQCEFPGIE